jgi:riboflavin synthase
MFTGIIEELGSVVALDATDTDHDALRLTVEGPFVTSDAHEGDSIAVSGVCLTVLDVGDGRFSADVMHETLSRSTLGKAQIGDTLNLERAVTLQTRLGGHLVQGHVDATAVLLEREHTPRWDVVRFSLPEQFVRYVVEKGSIAVDGVSLTVVAVEPDSFTVSLIPTTLGRTTLGVKSIGDEVNIEVDVMAKYAEKLLAAQKTEQVR